MALLHGCVLFQLSIITFVYLATLFAWTSSENSESEFNKPVTIQDTSKFSMITFNPCDEIMTSRSDTSPVALYTSQGMVTFLCDTLDDGKKWVYVQRHKDKESDFNNNWEEYSKGFGSTDGDFWLGNELIHQLTSWGSYELRIDMEFNGRKYFALYDKLKVDSEVNRYRLTLGNIIGGDVVDSFSEHSGYNFSTRDRDNDDSDQYHCAADKMSGWWFHDCLTVNLNAKLVPFRSRQAAFWLDLTGNMQSLDSTEMKMRKNIYNN